MENNSVKYLFLHTGMEQKPEAFFFLGEDTMLIVRYIQNSSRQRIIFFLDIIIFS